MERLFNHTISVGYFTEMILGLFGNGLVNKTRHDVFPLFLGLFRDTSVTNRSIKVDNICYIIHWPD